MSQYIVIFVFASADAAIFIWVLLTFTEHLLYDWPQEKYDKCIISLHNFTKVTQVLHSWAVKNSIIFYYLFVGVFLWQSFLKIKIFSKNILKFGLEGCIEYNKSALSRNKYKLPIKT